MMMAAIRSLGFLLVLGSIVRHRPFLIIILFIISIAETRLIDKHFCQPAGFVYVTFSLPFGQTDFWFICLCVFPFSFAVSVHIDVWLLLLSVHGFWFSAPAYTVYAAIAEPAVISCRYR